MVKSDDLAGAVLLHQAPPRVGSASRRLRLALLSTHGRATSSRFVGLTWSAGFLVVSGVASILVLSAAGAGEVGDVVALRLLAYASWLYGALGLAALLAPRVGDDGSARLAMLRGQNVNAATCSWLGITLRITAGVFLTALPAVLVALVVAPTSAAMLSRALLLPGLAVYALGLGATLGAVGALSLEISPKRPRWTAAGLVLIPYLLGLAAPGVPSIPGFFGSLLREMLRLGGGHGV